MANEVDTWTPRECQQVSVRVATFTCGRPVGPELVENIGIGGELIRLRMLSLIFSTAHRLCRSAVHRRVFVRTAAGLREREHSAQGRRRAESAQKLLQLLHRFLPPPPTGAR